MLVDSLLAGVATVLALTPGVVHPAQPVALVLAVLSAAPIAIRRRAPLSVLVVVNIAVVVDVLVYNYKVFDGIGPLVGVFSVAAYRPRPIAVLGWLITMGLQGVPYGLPGGWFSDLISTLYVTAAWVLGAGTRHWAMRAQRAEHAMRAERGRITRELHDIVAHHMSVVSVQSTLAEHILDIDPPAARKAMVTVGATSREALAEMRRLLDVLRMDDDDEGADTHPQPGLADLDALVLRVRDAGLRVEFAVTGAVTALRAGPDLCAYRTAQEALTNVLKHAGPATARLAVDYGVGLLTVTVIDDGVGAPGPGWPVTDGRGLAGLAERAALYGGTLAAGPRPEGGFRVLLRLPI